MPFSTISVATGGSAKSPRPDAFPKSRAACCRVSDRHSAGDCDHLGGRLGAGGDAGGVGSPGRARDLRHRPPPGHRGAGAHRLARGRSNSAARLLGEGSGFVPRRPLADGRPHDRHGTARADRPAAHERVNHDVRLGLRLRHAGIPDRDPARRCGRRPSRCLHLPHAVPACHYVDLGHGGHGRRNHGGRSQTRPSALAAENARRCGGRRARGRHCGTGPRQVRPEPARLELQRRSAVAVWSRRLHCRADRRYRRIAVQARSGPQRLFDAHSGSRRRARSARLAVLRDSYGGGIVSHVRDPMSIGVAVLASTGSIGRSTLQVLARQRERFRVVAITGHSNKELLAQQAAEWKPAFVGLVNGGKGDEGRGKGSACLVEAATHPDVKIVVNGIVGAAGLEATLAALRAGKRVALANKETLVMAGELVAQAAREGGGEIVPVDSEHSAVLQCLAGRRPTELARLILTASGGPFRTWPRERIAAATVAEALRHPTWKMGKKITVDSATLINKALEVIEAHFLFGLGYEAVEVVVHPQSVVHAFVEFVDGSVLAQVGFPTMELPILYALTHPARVPDAGTRRFDPVAAGSLTFEAVDGELYPAYRLGRAAATAAGTAPTVFNAANEIAVALFLEGAIPFGRIAQTIARVLDTTAPTGADSLEAVLAADAAARRLAREAACS